MEALPIWTLVSFKCFRNIQEATAILVALLEQCDQQTNSKSNQELIFFMTFTKETKPFVLSVLPDGSLLLVSKIAFRQV